MPADAPTDARSGLTYGQLKIRNDDYCPELWQKLDDLYCGGFQIEARAAKYIPALIGERTNRHAERLKSAAYINYFGEIVAYFVAALFTQELQITEAADSDNAKTVGGKADPAYAAFAKNADGKGTPLQKVLRCLLTTATIKRRALLLVDMPARPDDAEIDNLADEEKLGLDKFWCTEIPIESLIDWECDEDGELLWAIVNRVECKRLTPRDARDHVVESFKVWERASESGAVTWTLYECRYPKGKPPKDRDVVPLVGDGATSFKRIPILDLCLPDDLWIGNKIGPGALEHYQRRTSLNAAENKSLVALPVYKKGPQIGPVGGSVPSPQQRNAAAGKDPVGKFAAMGFVEIGKEDAIEFAEPHGRCYELVDKQLEHLKDELFRVTHQMAMSVGNNASTTRRSGESKKQDKSDVGIVLGAFGSEVRAFALKLYQTISDARGDKIVWTAHGLDDYDTEDRADLLEESLQLGAVDIPSVTFKRLHATHVALRLVRNAPPETQDQIRQEIQNNITTESVKTPPTGVPAEGEDDPNADHGTDPATDGEGPAATGSGSAPPKPRRTPAATPAAPKAAAKVAKLAPKAGKPAAAKAPPAPAAKKMVAGADGSTHELFDPAERMRASDESAGIADKVYRDLSEDYSDKQLEWVKHAQWRGPLIVPLSEIDWTKQQDWPATEDADHINDFVERIESDGYVKPIILVNEPNNDKLIIADGHHRALAYKKVGRDPMAYVANVGGVLPNGGDTDWRVMHDSQRGGSDQK